METNELNIISICSSCGRIYRSIIQEFTGRLFKNQPKKLRNLVGQFCFQFSRSAKNLTLNYQSEFRLEASNNLQEKSEILQTIYSFSSEFLISAHLIYWQAFLEDLPLH